MAKVKRSQFATFLNTNTPASPTWSKISSGVVEAVMEYNPSISEVQYIGDDVMTKAVEGYSPVMPINSEANNGEAVFEFLDALRKGQSILGSAESEIVNVYLYETASMTYYLAEKWTVAIAIDEFGGTGGEVTKLGYTLHTVGEGIVGSFSPSLSLFFAAPITTILTTLVIGGVPLTPVFSDNKAWLWYTLAVANGVSTIQMDSTLSGATIVQYDEATPVNQGNTASLAVGANNLSVDVTVASENVIYEIEVTRAAP